MVLNVMGKPDEALENYNKSLEIKIRVVGPEHLRVANTKHKCALLCVLLI